MDVYIFATHSKYSTQCITQSVLWFGASVHCCVLPMLHRNTLVTLNQFRVVCHCRRYWNHPLHSVRSLLVSFDKLSARISPDFFAHTVSELFNLFHRLHSTAKIMRRKWEKRESEFKKQMILFWLPREQMIFFVIANWNEWINSLGSCTFCMFLSGKSFRRTHRMTELN